jgi:A/G-specific adenine glycosylase
VPAVDGNVLRVLSRVCASEADVGLEATKRAFADALRPVIPVDAGDFTQSLIELGATVCVPNGEARCDACPLAKACRARADGRVRELPVKGAKKPRRIEKKTVLIVRDGKRILLGKRPAKGLLAGLYELPNAEGHLSEAEVLTLVRSLGLEPTRILRASDAKHIFTHIEWHMIAYDVTVSSDFDSFVPTDRLFLADRAERAAYYAIPSAFSAYVRYL